MIELDPLPGLPLGLGGLFVTVCGYFNLGLGNTYCGANELVTGGLYRFSRNPQYTASIVGLIGLSIGANSILAIVLSCVMSCAYVLMALVEEDWLKQRYGAPYRDYCRETARFSSMYRVSSRFDRQEEAVAANRLKSFWNSSGRARFGVKVSPPRARHNGVGSGVRQEPPTRPR